MKAHMDAVVAELLDATISLEAARQLFVDAYVAAALRCTKDDVTAAAALLGTHRNTLHNIIRARESVRSSMQRRLQPRQRRVYAGIVFEPAEAKRRAQRSRVER